MALPLLEGEALIGTAMGLKSPEGYRAEVPTARSSQRRTATAIMPWRLSGGPERMVTQIHHLLRIVQRPFDVACSPALPEDPTGPARHPGGRLAVLVTAAKTGAPGAA